MLAGRNLAVDGGGNAPGAVFGHCPFVSSVYSLSDLLTSRFVKFAEPMKTK
jgi:hypothetical protein